MSTYIDHNVLMIMKGKIVTEDKKAETIVSSLQEQIKRGDFGTKGRLPSVAQIARDYQVARNTAYNALNLLQSYGMVVLKGNAYYANYPIMRISGAPLFDKYLEKQGLTAVTENIVEPEIVPMPSDIAAMFDMQEGVHVIHRMRRHGTADIAYRLAENWYPVDLAGDYLEAMKQDPDLNVAGKIREQKGIAIATRHDDIIARLPTTEESKLLRIVNTTPILDVRRKFLAADKRVIFVSNQALVGAYFQLGYDSEHHRKESS